MEKCGGGAESVSTLRVVWALLPITPLPCADLIFECHMTVTYVMIW